MKKTELITKLAHESAKALAPITFDEMRGVFCVASPFGYDAPQGDVLDVPVPGWFRQMTIIHQIDLTEAANAEADNYIKTYYPDPEYWIPEPGHVVQVRSVGEPYYVTVSRAEGTFFWNEAGEFFPLGTIIGVVPTAPQPLSKPRAMTPPEMFRVKAGDRIQLANSE